MVGGAAGSPDDPGTLVLEIIEVLEAAGLDQDQFHLHDSFDVDALARLLSSATTDLEVRLTIEGVPLVVTPSDVHVIQPT